jgi:hypothetical protein
MKRARAHEARAMRPVGKTVLGMLAAWHGLVAAQNTFDLLATMGAAPYLRPLAGKNFALLRKVLARFAPSDAAIGSLLCNVILIEASAATMFAVAALDGEADTPGFVLSFALFGAFFLIDDALDDYDMGARHRATFTMLAAGYVAAKAAER